MAGLRIPRSWEIPERLATPERIFLDRRQVLAGLGLGALAAGLPWQLGCARPREPGPDASGRLLEPAAAGYAGLFPARRNPAYGLGGRALTPEAKAAAYNNFYELTSDKDRVWKLAAGYPVEPWTIEVRGQVARPRTLDLDEVMRRFPLEERLYRLRCVERWAMQVPWTGFPLRRLIDSVEPLSTARYVRFVSFTDPERLPGQKETPWYPWPYREALRLDEARHDLTFVVVGSYGHPLPMQHGAPVRLAVPWKYGYKSPKSIVGIELLAERPATFWNTLHPAEYGFYSNVDPGKPHPRWSQQIEQDLGTGERRATLLYNGYAAEVAALYDGREA
jgi:methionine sulfoxide reductase catalytic subunit